MLQFQSQISLNIVRQRWLPILKICIFETKALKIKFPLVFLISSKKSGTLLFKITPPSPIGLEILQNMAKIWRNHSPPPPPPKKRENKICYKYMHFAFTDICECHQSHIDTFWMLWNQKIFYKRNQLEKSNIPFQKTFFNNPLSGLR